MRRAAALLALCLMSSIASAAPVAPTELGTGDRPWVFVDRQGVTHVTWEAADGSNSQLHYRRRTPGATAFEPDRVLPVAEGTAFVNAFVVQDPAPSHRLVMVVERAPRVTGLPGTYALTSADSGVSWSAPVAIYSGGPSINQTDGPASLVANGGAAGLYVMNGNPIMRVVVVPASLAPLVPTGGEAQLSGDKANTGSVALDAAGQPVFVYGNLNQPFVRFGVTGPEVLATQHQRYETIKIAGGPKGVGVMISGGPVSGTELDVRLAQGGVLTAPVRLTASSDDPRQPFIAADASGRFHVACFSGVRNGIVYRRSDNGTIWSPPALVAGASAAGGVGLVVGAGPDGAGWAVWQEGNSSANRVLAAPLTTAVDDPSVPDTTGIVNPRVIRNRGALLVVSSRVPLAAARKKKCVLVRVQTTKPARIGVAIFSGAKSIRVFGRATVRFTKPGKKLICIPVPLRANTFNIRKNYKYAFAVQDGAKPKKGEKPPREVSRVFTFLP